MVAQREKSRQSCRLRRETKEVFGGEKGVQGDLTQEKKKEAYEGENNLVRKSSVPWRRSRKKSCLTLLKGEESGSRGRRDVKKGERSVANSATQIGENVKEALKR